MYIAFLCRFMEKFKPKGNSAVLELQNHVTFPSIAGFLEKVPVTCRTVINIKLMNVFFPLLIIIQTGKCIHNVFEEIHLLDGT